MERRCNRDKRLDKAALPGRGLALNVAALWETAMLTLYDSPDSGNAYKIRLLLSHLDLDYKRVILDIDKAETRTPQFLAKNPNGRVPALELDDGTVLPESNAILFYFAEGTPYLPFDRLGRAQALQWMFFEQYSHEPNIATVRYWIKHKIPVTPFIEAAMPAKRKAGYAALDVMETHLKRRDFFVGERYSIADIALYAYTHVAHEVDFDLKPYPAIRAWMDLVALQENHIGIDHR
ncbi:MAG: glutathione S-transferase [Alphaproteobacteria bacterium]|jgi:glutathione S-transferase|nr:glutathione S-transferase [Alphaproteobacteria bacterium]